VTFLDEEGEGEIVAFNDGVADVQVGDFIRQFRSSELIIRQKEFVDAVKRSNPRSKDAPKIMDSGFNMIEQESNNVFDLHSSALPSLRHAVSGHDILLFQLNTAKKHLRDARKMRFSHLVFIHGNGSGRLKDELEKWLNGVEYVSYFDASYRLYGQGAIEVQIFNSK